MKVYAGSLDGRHSFCVGAPSLKAAHEIIQNAGFNNVSLHYLRNYWSVSRNAEQVAAAGRWPGTLLIGGALNHKRDYVPLSHTFPA